MQPEVDEIVRLFLQSVDRSLHPMLAKHLRIETLSAPHQPTPLPPGWQGVYAFRLGQVWLKVGKVGPKSGARWVSQHYKHTRSMSNLAWSLLRYTHLSNQADARLPTDLKARLRGVAPEAIGDWIKQNTDRYNILLDASCGREALTQLEETALAWLKPVFEGRMK